MITSTNSQDYTILFNDASVKLGLLPFDKITGYTQAGEPITKQYVNAWNGSSWAPRVCEPSDFDSEGRFCITVNGVQVVSTGISSLNEYFQRIGDLAGFALSDPDKRTGSDPYFLRLPLNEPFFEIDANTRAISVPAQLRQIAVRGDKFAEVVFFKIDRYFDAIDLATRHIYIEWEVPDGNGGVIKGFSRDYLKDLQSEKGKIIFGWIIDENLTAAVGNIRFAVRFVEWDDGNYGQSDSSNAPSEGRGLSYSFSTLPAVITVVDSLNYSLFEDDSEMAAQQATTLTNTQVANFKALLQSEVSDPDIEGETSPETANKARWVLNLDAPIEENVPIRKNLVLKPNDQASLELVVSAVSDQAGAITYAFAKDPIDAVQVEAVPFTVKYTKITLTDAALADNVVQPAYYRDDNGIFKILSKDDIRDILNNSQDKTAYILAAHAFATAPGTYHAKARAMVTGYRSSIAESNKIFIPAPEEPNVVTYIGPEITEENHIASFVFNKETYSLDINEQAGQSGSNIISNIIINKVGDTGPSSITLGESTAPTFSFGVSESNDPDALETHGHSYVWYKATEIDSEGHLIKPQSLKGYSTSITITDEAPLGPGYYTVQAINKLNNVEEPGPIGDAGILRVTRMPLHPVINFSDWANTVYTNTVSTNIPIIDPKDGGTVEFQWYKFTADNTDDEKATLADMVIPAGQVTFTNDQGAVPFTPKTAGYYYFILSNTLNGATVYESTASNKYGIIYVEAINPNQGNDEPEVVSQHTMRHVWATTGEDIPEGALALINELTQPENVLVNDGETPTTPATPDPATISFEDNNEVVGTWTFVNWVISDGDNGDFVATGTWNWELAQGE